jgi:RNA polymerase sigma-70 factor (ECF subfamily)
MIESADKTQTLEAAASGGTAWSRLVDRVRREEPDALEELYQLFSKGIRYYLWHHLGPQDLDDRVHDAFLAVTESIRNGELREPDRLLGFVRTVVRRQVATQIDHNVHARRSRFSHEMLAVLHDRHPGPEENAIHTQNRELAMRILRSIPTRDREVLIRFYLREQTPPEICRDLNLSETQFRLIKSRAKARFGELGRARLANRRANPPSAG